jgi:hypothetical protein
MFGRLSYLVDDLPNGAGVDWTFGRNPASQVTSAIDGGSIYFPPQPRGASSGLSFVSPFK